MIIILSRCMGKLSLRQNGESVGKDRMAKKAILSMRLKKQDDHEPLNPRRSLNTIVMKNPAAVTGVLDLKSENDKTK